MHVYYSGYTVASEIQQYVTKNLCANSLHLIFWLMLDDWTNTLIESALPCFR